MPTAELIDLRLDDAAGWHTTQVAGGYRAWWSGHARLDGVLLEGSDGAAVIAATLGPALFASPPDTALLKLDGHFALAIQDTVGNLLIATDRVRSIPLLMGLNGDRRIIGGNFDSVRAALDGHTPDAEARLQLAMAGYTLGDATLDARIRVLQPGEWAKVTTTGQTERGRWYRYRPWLVDVGATDEEWHQRFLCTTDALFAKVVRSLEGRPVMLPLSGGFDSRLVASALHRHGHRAVHCYSYGRRGNFEAAAARRVAEKLGYRWDYLEYTHSSVRQALHSEVFEHYRATCDTGAAIPFFQDFAAITELRRRGLVPAGAVFINGNSGDFISGNHVPSYIYDMDHSLGQDGRQAFLLQHFLSKHFALWQDLSQPANLATISRRLENLLYAQVPADLPAGYEFAVWEALEFEARQSKFVINGQRVYDYFGHLWRLPLWDNDYLTFWEAVPPHLKREQRLYREALQTADWGGVWRSIPLNPQRRWYLPAWARAARLGLQAASLPFGRAAWQKLDKRIFGYWLDSLGVSGFTSYPSMLLDRRGARSPIAFRSREYLELHDRLAVHS